MQPTGGHHLYCIELSPTALKLLWPGEPCLLHASNSLNLAPSNSLSTTGSTFGGRQLAPTRAVAVLEQLTLRGLQA